MKISLFINRVLFGIGYWNTIYLNFKALPFPIARKLPIIVGRKVTLMGIEKGCIQLSGDIQNIRFGIIRLGMPAEYPIFSNKREYSLLRNKEGACIEFAVNKNELTNIRNGFSIVNEGYIKFETNCLLNQHCSILCYRRIHFGKNFRSGWNCQFLDSDIHFSYDIEQNIIPNPYGEIEIGNHVWIANACSITKNAKIPDYSIVASSSLVNKDFSTLSSKGNLFAGTPAKLKRTGIVRPVDVPFEREHRKIFKNNSVKHIIPDEKFSALLKKYRF